MTDLQLLEQYVRSGSPDAFAQLVVRHADWVYSLALRQVRDPHMAEDVTQAVFLVLAQKARTIKTDRPLNAWLFKVARYSCAHAVRAQARREHHEREAAAMNSQSVAPDEQQVWEQVGPQLEQVVEQLPIADRDAILLRFYQRKSMAEVGDALGVSEDAAKKRVAKAIERLRGLLAHNQVIVPGAVLAGMLLSFTTQTAPGNVVATCCASASVGASSIAKGVIIMIGAKAKIGLAAAIVAVVALVGGSVAMFSSYASKAEPPAATQPAVAIATTARLVAARPRELIPQQRTQGRVQCAISMKNIGLALFQYAQRHNGNFPDDLGALPLSQKSLEAFLCPNADHGTVTDRGTLTLEQIGAWINANSDYVYLGKGLTMKTAAPDIVIMYEKPEIELQQGMNMLMGDGHVEFDPPEIAEKQLEQSNNARAQSR